MADLIVDGFDTAAYNATYTDQTTYWQHPTDGDITVEWDSPSGPWEIKDASSKPASSLADGGNGSGDPTGDYTGVDASGNIQAFWKETTETDPTTTDLVLCAEMNDAAAQSVVDDSSATDNDGEFQSGGVQANLTSTTGKLSEAIIFDGSNDHVSFPSNAAYDFTTDDEVSVFQWVDLDTVGSGDGFVSRFDAPNDKREWELSAQDASGDTARLQTQYGDASGLASGQRRTSIRRDLCDGFHFIGFTYNAGTVIFYFDGYPVAGYASYGTVPSALNYEAQVLLIGNRALGQGNYADGNLDQTLVYKKALSAAEVLYLWNSGNGREPIVPVATGVARSKINASLAGGSALLRGLVR